MNPEEVLEKFGIIANISVPEISQWSIICEEACEEIKRHLKSGVDINENSHRLNSAAAALAFYRYILYSSAIGNTESFTAGEIRVKNNATAAVQIAYKVWIEAKQSINDLLEDNEFVFERTV